jgi:hypothetical protein
MGHMFTPIREVLRIGVKTFVFNVIETPCRKMNKQLTDHVIFLGAGASFTSGYPIGQELRLRITSKKHIAEELRKIVSPESVDPKGRELFRQCLDNVEYFADSIELFRHGGFGTVDEFSRLASTKYPKRVQDVKALMRFVLSLHNPENNFHESDYYPFVQKLFDNTLYGLKPNLTVITFNYDCYLDFLIQKAFRYRQKLSPNPDRLDKLYRSILTSGFYQRDNVTEWAEQNANFNFYKLHGSITYGNDEHWGYKTLFEHDTYTRLDWLNRRFIHQDPPPIVFPWELFDSRSERFVSEDEFILAKECETRDQPEQGQRLFKHFVSMWQAAEQKVADAKKISFVGLSMHEFLDKGFRYLLKNNRNDVQIVVANPDNQHFKDDTTLLNPDSPCGKVAALLKNVAPDMKWRYSGMSNSLTMTEKISITPRYSFKEFIEREME